MLGMTREFTPEIVASLAWGTEREFSFGMGPAMRIHEIDQDETRSRISIADSWTNERRVQTSAANCQPDHPRPV